MKRFWLIVFSLLLIFPIMAQMQNGVVKTRGRMVNNKHVPGVGLPGAVVSIKDRTDVGVKNNDGSFSFPVKGKQFMVQSVTKKDYALVDADAAPKTYLHSQDTFFLVMETPDQILQDKLDSERRIRRTLRQQLQAREDEIERLKSENKITQEEYHKALQKLYADEKNNEKLIQEMAERYSTLDYDRIDEFYRQVNNYIEQGELARADSLLKTRGDVESQVADVIEQGKVIQQKKEEIEQAEEVHKSDIDELSRRCYSFYETFLMQHQNDSAAKYIEFRAALDTTNVEWQNAAGEFIRVYQAQYDKALEYYKRGLSHSIKQYGEESEWVAYFYNGIGIILDSFGDYPKALEYYQKALEIRLKVFGPEHPDVATSYNNIGYVYISQGDYPKALEYHQKAIEIRLKVLDTEHPDVATSYGNIGSIYNSQGDYPKALEYYQKALNIQLKVFGPEHPDVAISYNNIGYVYNSQGNYPKALEYLQKALDIQVKVFGSEHPGVATTYNNIGLAYYSQGEYPKALEYYQKALVIRLKVLGPEHPDVATSYNNIGTVHDNQGDYTKALEYHQKALVIRLKVFDSEHPSVATTYNNIGQTYYSQGDYPKALEYYQKALVIRLKVLDTEHPDVAT
ncbi:MAG: tetratricopeptide repeat protein, partial [Bacteroidaceae bacterium]|nr:tetratricopeptide repeat protein [Bacteroidaceae bacterium]